MGKEVVIVMGYPAAGKTTYTERFVKENYVRLNRDEKGGSIDDLTKELDKLLGGSDSKFVLDNTFATRESRQKVIACAKQHNATVRCVFIDASIEDAQVNAVTRIVRKYGKLLSPEEIKSHSKKDPNCFPATVLFRYRKQLEEPNQSEGFTAVDVVPFQRTVDQSYTNKALLLDYDGTLRKTKSGEKYPRTPEDIEILPGRKQVLLSWQAKGYKLLGVSNQGDVARGKLSLEQAKACFAQTNKLLGIEIEVSFCPHDPAPISCYCRKPMPGMGVDFIERYQLNRKETIMVGDMTTDKTFAQRCGVLYQDQQVLFEGATA